MRGVVLREPEQHNAKIAKSDTAKGIGHKNRDKSILFAGAKAHDHYVYIIHTDIIQDKEWMERGQLRDTAECFADRDCELFK